MITQLKFIKHNNFLKFLNRLAENYRVITPYGDKDYLWQSYENDFTYNRYRPITSVRQFFTASTEDISDYFNPGSKTRKPFCIVGAKACDLTSLITQDYVFLEGEADPGYKDMRDNNFIISGDCTAFKNVCFCLTLEINPYPEKLFDLNISPVQKGYLVEVGSDKGLRKIKENSKLFESADDGYIVERERNREEIVCSLTGYLSTLNLAQKKELSKLMKDGYANSVWAQEALRCVECGACIMNCPTCHCFLLFDTKSKDGNLRGRVWDGCQYKNFTRVAGGANALKFREYRLRNRYIKKFEFFPERINTYACTGCGRCIESCPAKIDLREIFKQLSKDYKASVKPAV